MTRLLTFISALLFTLLVFPFPEAAAAFSEQHNERYLLVFWENDQIQGNGRHRPYSNLELRAGSAEALWKGQSDVRGAFQFRLPGNTLSGDTEHLLTLAAFDQFGRAIVLDAGTPDLLQAVLLPNLTAKGHTAPHARVRLKDSSGNVLQEYEADAAGNYEIENAPRSSIIEIESDADKVEIPFREGLLPDTDQAGVSAPEEMHPSALGSSAASGLPLFLKVFLIILILGGGSGGIFLFLRRRWQNPT